MRICRDNPKSGQCKVLIFIVFGCDLHNIYIDFYYWKTYSSFVVNLLYRIILGREWLYNICLLFLFISCIKQLQI